MIVWGERLWRSPGAASRPLLRVATALGIDQRGPGMLEIPESANGRGLREVGCAGDGPAAIRDGGFAAAISSSAPSSLILFDSNPVRDFPQSADWATGAPGQTSWSRSRCSTTRHQVRQRRAAARKPRREGGRGHPSRRPPAARAPRHRGPGRPATRLALARRALGLLGADLGLDSQPAVFDAVAAAVDIYEGLTLDEIGGLGVRWQERAGRIGCSARRGLDRRGRRADAAGNGAADGSGLARHLPRHLGRRSDRAQPLAAVPHRPAAARALEGDAEQLQLQNGQQVTVSANGDPVEARVAIRERMPRGRRLPDRGHRRGQRQRARQRAAAAGRGEAGVIPLADVNFAEATWIMVVKSIVIFLVVFMIVPVLTVVERKLIGRFQHRYGPNRIGPSACSSRSPTSSSSPARSASARRRGRLPLRDRARRS